MIAARRRALLLILAAVAIIGALVLLAAQGQAPPEPAGKPRLLLLTSLPLIFSDEFSLKGGSPPLTELSKDYEVLPVSTAAPAELRRGRLLLMAQPPAQTAENLVALDQWLRDGGRVLLLADPLLEWPSPRPLGDPLRPSPVFADTGLLKHWAVRLSPPAERGPQMRRLGSYEVMTVSSGSLDGNCQVSVDRFVARCRIGRGQATIIADADFLNLKDLDGPTGNNLKGLAGELANLQQE